MPACEQSYPVEVYHFASVLYSEARGESREGQVAVLSALRNGATGYRTGRITPDFVELVLLEMRKPVSHNYRHWINLRWATDERQVGIARRAIRGGDALRVGRHWFY